jgi:murein DD-endopeptidase MepM/ murein hydrolase activator NlpD
MDVRSASPAAPAAADQRHSDAERAQIGRLAHEFEAMFLSEMLRGMRRSMLSDTQDEGLGNETMTDTFDGELGLSLSKAGGLGLATMMMEALTRQRGDTAPAQNTPMSQLAANALDIVGVSSSEQPTGTTSAVPDISASAAAPGPVTSPFGWRADPLTGRPAFHAGTDIRLAYGQDVQAVAPGRVASVGDRQGYGLTVVVDHGNGLETRYAHLSGTSVRQGDSVGAGQVIARSGNSGRSTGPHLHLEARQNGRPVDVSVLLKDPATPADSYADESHVRSVHED